MSKRWDGKSLFEVFRGKEVLIVYRDSNSNPNDFHVWRGRIIDVSSTHLLEKDRFGRYHLLKLENIEKIKEIK